MSGVLGYTGNYSFKLVNFDWSTWHDYEHDNWRTLDAVLAAATSLTNVLGPWQNSLAVVVGDRYVDTDTNQVYEVAVAHTTPATGTFETSRRANPTYWTLISGAPVNKGTWTNGVTYSVNDIVLYRAAFYVCKTKHRSSALFATDTAYWQLILDIGSAAVFTGSTINGVTIGDTTPAAGTFTTLTANGDVRAGYEASGANFAGIGSNASGNLVLKAAGSAHTYLTAAAITPATDNTHSMGSASFRWSVYYGGTGTINTSDATEKDADQTTFEVTPLTEAEIAWSKSLAKEIGVYRFLDAIAAKGDGARKHIGMTVQRAIALGEAHGLDPFAYGFICYDAWDDQYEQRVVSPAEYDEEGNEITPAVTEQVLVQPAGDSYGFRMDELLAFIARGFDARLAALEAAL